MSCCSCVVSFVVVFVVVVVVVALLLFVLLLFLSGAIIYIKKHIHSASFSVFSHIFISV